MSEKVYVIEAEGGPVKIGVSANPERRVVALRPGSAWRLSLARVWQMPDAVSARVVERMAHRTLESVCRYEEWFDATVDEAAAVINEAIRGQATPPAMAELERMSLVYSSAGREVVARAAGLPVGWSGLEEIEDKARAYAAAAKSENTNRAYASDWRHFLVWCDARLLVAMPAELGTVVGYITDHAGKLCVSTLRRRLSAIRQAHKYAGHPLDTAHVAFKDVWIGIRKEHGRPADQKAALVIAELRRAVEALPDSLSGLRDRALLLVGFGAALRRSELVALDVTGDWSTITETADGLVIRLAKSKTDQTGQGVTIGVPYGANPSTCPVRAWRAWKEAAGLDAGPAFRAVNRHGQVAAERLTDRAVSLIVKRAVEAGARAAGMSPAEASVKAEAFAGHSLRSGLATSAAANDAPGHLVQRHLRHSRFDTTARYIRAGELFKRNAAGMAGM